MTKKTKTSRARLPRPLPADACPACGTKMNPARGTLALPINGEEIKVPRVPHLVCPKCGEQLLNWEQTRLLSQGARQKYRDKYGLLSPEEIVALRGRLGLTQVDLAKLLRLGANTISRWEAGRNVQTAALDVLLRLVERPDNLAFLKRRAA